MSKLNIVFYISFGVCMAAYIAMLCWVGGYTIFHGGSPPEIETAWYFAPFIGFGMLGMFYSLVRVAILNDRR